MITINCDDNGDRDDKLYDSCNDLEDGEKAKMLRKYSIDPAKLGSKAKIFNPPPTEKRNSLPNNKVGHPSLKTKWGTWIHETFHFQFSKCSKNSK